MKKIICFIISVLMIFSFNISGFSCDSESIDLTVTLNPVCDGGYDRYPTWDGNGGTLPVTRSNAYTSNVGRTSFLKFDLSKVREKMAEDYIPVRATVKLTLAISDDDSDLRLALYRYDNDDWNEKTVYGADGSVEEMLSVPEPLSAASLSELNEFIVSQSTTDPSLNYVVLDPKISTNSSEPPSYTLDITGHLLSELENEEDNFLSFEMNYRHSGKSKTYRIYSKDYTGNDDYKPQLCVEYVKKVYYDAFAFDGISGLPQVRVNDTMGYLTTGDVQISADIHSWDEQTRSAVLFGALYRRDENGVETMLDIKCTESFEVMHGENTTQILDFNVPSDECYIVLWVTNGISSQKVYSSAVYIDSEKISAMPSTGDVSKADEFESRIDIDRKSGTIALDATVNNANKPFGFVALREGFSIDDITRANISDAVVFAGPVSADASKLKAAFTPESDEIIYEVFNCYIDSMCMDSGFQIPLMFYYESLPVQVFELMKKSSGETGLSEILNKYSALIGIKSYDGITNEEMAAYLYPVDDANPEEFLKRYNLVAGIHLLKNAADSDDAMKIFKEFSEWFGMDTRLKNTVLGENYPPYAYESFRQRLLKLNFETESFGKELDRAAVEAAVCEAVKYADLMNAFEDTEYFEGYFEDTFDKSRYSKIKSKEKFYKELIDYSFDDEDDIREAIIKSADDVYESERESKSGGSGGSGGSGKSGNYERVGVIDASLAEHSKLPDTPGISPVLPGNHGFKDVLPESWMYEYVNQLMKIGVVSGYEDNSFRPDGSISREEFVKLVVSAFDIALSDTELIFEDVESGRWSEKYINAAASVGIINGKGNSCFAPAEKISRQDAAVICTRILKSNGDNSKVKEFYDYASIDGYASEAVNTLSSLGILNGDENGNFRPHDSITRAESCALIYKLLEVYNK